MSDLDVSGRMRSLQDIPVSQISENEWGNPRIHFPPEEIDRLAESIAKEGVLVPIVVYPDGERFRLIDGERRWRCAKLLNLETIPAVITDPPDPSVNLVRMFNIHMVREPWGDMPTAWALEKLIAETGVTNDRELADITGLHPDRIKRLRHALELPLDYQRYIDERTIPLNWFWELKRNVIDPMGKKRPALAEEFKEGEILDAFVNKRLNGVVTDTVSFRKVLSIINIAERESPDPTAPSVLDDTIRSLVRDEEMTIDDAYQDTVEVVVESDKLERRTLNMLKSFERLLERARSESDVEHVRRIARQFIERLSALIS